MQSFEYSKKAHQFCNLDFVGINFRWVNKISDAESSLRDVENACKTMEVAKKYIFTGKNAPVLTEEYRAIANVPDAELKQFLSLMHGVFGASGELGEVIEAIKAKDVSKIVDEVGDVLWYLNEILLAAGSSFEEAMLGNYAKLAMRYAMKNGFDPSAAHTKDHAAEALAQANANKPKVP